MLQPVPTIRLCTGNATQVAGSNDPDGVAHGGRVLFSAIATGSGTWAITFSFSANLGIGVYDESDVKTITITNSSPGGVKTMEVSTAAKNFRGWISSVTGTVSGTLYLEGR